MNLQNYIKSRVEALNDMDKAQCEALADQMCELRNVLNDTYISLTCVDSDGAEEAFRQMIFELEDMCGRAEDEANKMADYLEACETEETDADNALRRETSAMLRG